MSDQPPIVRYGEITRWQRDTSHPDPWVLDMQIHGYPISNTLSLRGSHLTDPGIRDMPVGKRVKITIELIEPKTRVAPWQPEEVPLGAWVKDNRYSMPVTQIIVGVEHRGRILMADGSRFDPSYMASQSCSTDGGKTWRPAGRVEEVLE